KNNQKLLDLKHLKSNILNKKTENITEQINSINQELTILISKKEKFTLDFKKYFSDEVIKIKNNTNENLTASKEKYLNTLNHETLKRENERKEFLTKNSYKNLKYLKKEHNKNIKKLKQELKTIKTEVTLLENKNKKETKEFIINQKEIRRKSKENIKNLKKNILVEIDTNKDSNLEILFKEVKDDIKSTKTIIYKQKRTHYFKKVNMAYLFIAPAAFGAIVFTILPVIFMIVASQFKIDIVNLGKSQFVGFYNFQQIFQHDVEFRKSLTNTLIYALITIGLLSVVTLGMAAWLSKNTKIHNAVTTMVFTPHIASLVSISILWIALLSPTGLINQLLEVFGIKGPRWLLQENTSLFSVSMVTVWKDIGYYVLIIIAGLQAIPAYVYEAAKLDKSSKTKTFFRITVPLLTPTLSFVFVNKFINSFKVFAPIEIMTNGGPMGSSTVLSYWIYKSGRLGFNYGQAMSGAIILTVIITFFTILNFRFFNRKIQYT
ncbi:MAG: ABC transporter permease subunit, partial [Acholeplasmataceae bacterium]